MTSTHDLFNKLVEALDITVDIEECARLFDKVYLSHYGKYFKDSSELAYIIIFLILKKDNKNENLRMIRGKFTLRKLSLIQKYLGSSTKNGGDNRGKIEKLKKEAFSKLQLIDDETLNKSANLDDLVTTVTESFYTFLSSKSIYMQINIITYIAWQFHNPALSFNKMCKHLKTPPPSLRAALRSLADTIGLKWAGVNTWFPAWNGFDISQNRIQWAWSSSMLLNGEKKSL